MNEGPFRAEDAHKQLTNLTNEQAQQWVRVANMDYERRRKIGGSPGMCREKALRKANCEMMGEERPYEG